MAIKFWENNLKNCYYIILNIQIKKFFKPINKYGLLMKIHLPGFRLVLGTERQTIFTVCDRIVDFRLHPPAKWFRTNVNTTDKT